MLRPSVSRGAPETRDCGSRSGSNEPEEAPPVSSLRRPTALWDRPKKSCPICQPSYILRVIPAQDGGRCPIARTRPRTRARNDCTFSPLGHKKWANWPISCCDDLGFQSAPEVSEPCG